MLFELYIKDFILIEEAVIPFKDGFNVLTGETGAGKSMVIGALNLILGGTANKEMIRLGAEAAYIKASFDMPEFLQSELAEMGIEADSEVLTLGREIQIKGKSIARINGQVCTISQLKAISTKLVNIHGQMDNQDILNKESQLKYLDFLCGNEHVQNVSNLKVLHYKIKDKKSSVDLLKEKVASQSREEDFLSFQLREIESANLKKNEDEVLEKEFEFLSHLEKISENVGRLLNWIKGEYGEGGISILSKFSSDLEKLSPYDEKLGNFSKSLKDAFFILDDLGKDMDSYNENLEQNPEKLNHLQQRLDEINKLKSKYGKRVEDIAAYENVLRADLSALSKLAETLEHEISELEKLTEMYLSNARALSQVRQEHVSRFERLLTEQLKTLNLPEVVFEIQLTQKEMSENGIDEAVFFISTNAGQPVKPMHKVVSGGELSRIMLAIKILVGEDQVSTMVFDEIDAGISGQTAHVVGEKLALLSRKSQVVSITHLPQIAVFGDQNLMIQKSDVNGVTKTFIQAISAGEKTEEIVRLVGGKNVTDATILHANHMIEQAKAIKKEYQ